jgi:hypothetical protein
VGAGQLTGRCVENVSFWICAVVLVVLVGNWVIHKFRQFKYQIKQLERECRELNKIILKYGKQKK